MLTAAVRDTATTIDLAVPGSSLSMQCEPVFFHRLLQQR